MTKPVQILLIVFLLTGFGLPLFAAGTDSEGNTETPKVKVLDLRIEALGGMLTVDSNMIIKQSGLLPGMNITGDDVQEAIKQLWKLKLFSEIEIVKDRESSQGWYLVIRVKEYPRLEEWKLIGTKKIKADDIRDKVKLNRGQTLRDEDLFQAEKTIREMYAAEGYLRVQINTAINDGSLPSTRRVVTQIVEGDKVRIDEIRFVSADSGKLPFSQRKLRGQMKETKQRIFIFRSGKFERDNYENDKKLVTDYFRNHGYRDAQIVHDTVSYSENGKYLSLTLTVSPGPLYFFGDVTFEGNALFTDHDLLEKINLRKGEKYSQDKMDMEVTEAIRGAYLDRGYLAASINPTLRPVTGSTKIDITENQEFKVRKVDVTGNTKTKDFVIRREIVQMPGETFDRSKLQRSVRELTILNFFETVEPQVNPAGDKEVDVRFEVKEKQTDQANVQVGYSQTDGLIGAVGFTMPNVFGNAQRFVFDWSFGSYYRNFSISFDEPYLLYPQTSVGGTLSAVRRGGTTYGYDEIDDGGSVRFGKRLTWPDDYFKLNYSYSLDHTKYFNFTSDFIASNPQGIIENQWRTSSVLTQIVSRDSRDNPEFPTLGSVQTWSLSLAGGPLGGTDRYYKTTLSSEWYFPMFLKLVMYSTTEAGIMNSFTGNPSDIPYINYFFMGGSGLSLGVPLRGYNDRSIGPQTKNGIYAIGGKSYFKQGLEMRIPIVPNPTIYGLMFAEAGNVWLEPIDMDPGNLKRSAGFGVRIFMPMIGLIGLDYGYGFDNADNVGNRKGEWMPHFQFGRGF